MKDEEFINHLLSIRDYWSKEKPNSAKEALDGFVFSFLAMCDGESGINDFHSLTIIDDEDGKAINPKWPLHERLCEILRDKGEYEPL